MNFYKRYINKNGKKLGPYYYSSKKVDGKVISTYLGTEPPNKLRQLNLPKFSKKTLTISAIVLSLIIVVLLVNLIFHLELFSTGNIPLSTVDDTIPIKDIPEKTLTPPITTPAENAPIINTVQEQATINQPVKWQKEISLSNSGKTTVQLPREAQNIAVYKINSNGQKEKVNDQQVSITAKASSEINIGQIQENKDTPILKFFKKIISFITGKAITIQDTQEIKEVVINENSREYLVEYETPFPTVTEQESANGKTIALSNAGSVAYQNVLVFTNIPENLNAKGPENVKIYWVEQNEFIQPEKVEDKDSNGIYDYVEFIAPYSNSTFEIIVITKAEHLDGNRVFISDIYNQVKELDNNWSEEIQSTEYVRVTFEKNLTNQNDITLYPRIIKGNPKIEVYEENSDIKIAEFTDIIPEEYNTVYLTELQGEQDTFDLRILGGSLEFNHIIDPIVVFANIQGVNDIGLTPLDNESFVVAYINISSNNAEFAIWYTNGTRKLAPITIAAAVGTTVSRISVLSINSTHFVVGFTTSGGLDRRVGYTTSGAAYFSLASGDGAIGANFHDIKLAYIGGNIMYCYIDSTEGDSDTRIYNSITGALIGGEANINTAVSPSTNLNNILDCVGVGSSAVVLFEYDDATDDDATYHFINSANTETVPDTDIDTTVGNAGQITVASLDQNKFVLLWYDSVDQDITMAIRDINNIPILAPTDIDTTVGTSSRIAAATVKNPTTGLDNFVVTWYDQATTDILAAVYDSSGSVVTSQFVVDSNPSTTPRLMYALGENDATGISLCPGNFIIAYTNSTVSSVFKTYNINGSEWNGNCPIPSLPPSAYSVEPIPSMPPLEGAIRPITFNVSVSDSNGYLDITNVAAQFSMLGEPTRINSSCILQSGAGNNANYSCTINMQYYDKDGNWNVTINATDSQAQQGTNTSQTFTYQLLKAMVINSPVGGLTWPILTSGQTNIQSNNDPTIIENTGNYEGPIIITSKDLVGETTPSDVILALNIKASPISGSECSGTQLTDSFQITISGSNLPRGQSATEDIYYCMAFVPTVTAQTYSAKGANAWIIEV
ncbi:MAG: hypothetical protein AABW63_01415 [Nanoarchaeota archaeon]